MRPAPGGGVTEGGPALVAPRSLLRDYAGRRCRITTSSVPEPGPLFVPDGWPLSYGFDWLGQPV